MAKEDFLNCVVKQVELQWPRLNQPYRYNNNTRRTEPCEPTANHAAWTVSWNMNADEARDLYKKLLSHFNECKARNPKIGKMEKVFGHKQDENGNHQFTAKRNCVNSAGQGTTAPPVVDAHKQPLADKAIWSGSIGSVAFSAVPVADPDKVWGISLLLSAVQVITPKYGSTAVDEFDEYKTDDKTDAEKPSREPGDEDDIPW